jgi:hypothetical protein
MTFESLWRRRKALELITERPAWLNFQVPLKLRNPLNGSGGATKAARYATNARRQRERAAGRWLAEKVVAHAPVVSLAVLLTRVSPRAFDDDGLVAAFKSVRDGIAEAWGINDASDRITWEYDWRPGKTEVVLMQAWVMPLASRIGANSELQQPTPREVRVTPNVIRARGGA